MDTAERSRALQERYGTHRPVRRAALITLVVVVAAVSLGWLGWATWINADPPVKGAMVSFDVVSTHRVEATVQVRVRNQQVTGSCLLRASAPDHSIVGELTIPVDGTTASQREVSVRTERRATTVEVLSCTGKDGS